MRGVSGSVATGRLFEAANVAISALNNTYRFEAKVQTDGTVLKLPSPSGTFSLDGVSGPASNLTLTLPSSCNVGQTLNPSVTVRDANGTPLSGKTATFSAVFNGTFSGSPSPPNVRTTNASGVASVNWTPNVPGSATITVEVDGKKTSATVSVALTGTVEINVQPEFRPNFTPAHFDLNVFVTVSGAGAPPGTPVTVTVEPASRGSWASTGTNTLDTTTSGLTNGIAYANEFRVVEDGPLTVTVTTSAGSGATKSFSMYWLSDPYSVSALSPVMTLSCLNNKAARWLDWSPDGNRLGYSALNDLNCNRIWDFVTQGVVQFDRNYSPEGVRFKPDGTEFCVANSDFYRINASTGVRLNGSGYTQPNTDFNDECMAFLSNSTFLVGGNKESDDLPAARAYSLSGGGGSTWFNVSKGNIANNALFGLDVHAGTSRVVGCDREGYVHLWNTSGGLIQEHFIGDDNGETLEDVLFSPDGSRIAVSGNSTLCLFNGSLLGQVFLFVPDNSNNDSCAFVDYRGVPAVAVAADHNMAPFYFQGVLIYDLDGRTLAKMATPSRPNCVAWNATRKLLAVGHQAGTAILYLGADDAPPALAVQLPQSAPLATGSAGMSGNVSDPSGLREVSYRVNGGAWSGLSPDGAGDFSVTLTGLVDGQNTIEVTAKDLYGNTGTVTRTVDVVNSPPGVSASPASSTIGGTTLDLTATGEDDTGEAGLSYTWSLLAGPDGGSVSFSVNDSNAAKATTATFDTAGSYLLRVSASDPGALTGTADILVEVAQTFTSIQVSPASASVPQDQSEQFLAIANDQFGDSLVAQPSLAWTVSGGGVIGSFGRFSADTLGGPFTVTASSGAISGTASVTVTAPPPPTVNGIEPATGAQGSTFDAIVIGENFRVNPGNPTVTFSGSGITVNSVSNVGPTQLTVNLTIATNAPVGMRDLTVLNADGNQGSRTGAFTVTPLPPTIAQDPSPASGVQGSSYDLTITGANFKTVPANPTVSFSGAGITVNSVSGVAANQMTANITIDPTAATGLRDLTVTNADGGAATRPNAFSVSPSLPTISQNANPGSGVQGTSLEIIIVGSNFKDSPADPAVSFSGTGIVVNSVSFDNFSQVRANISIATDATLGLRDLIVANADGGAATRSNSFSVQPLPPTVAGVSPPDNVLVQGFSGSITITGSNFRNAGGAPALSFGGPGIAVASVTFDSPAQLTASISIAVGATLGMRSLTVTNFDSGTHTLNNAVRIHAPPVALFDGGGQSGMIEVVEGTAVSFDANESSDPDGGTITNYAWDFGDGTTSPVNAAANIDHLFGAPGVYTVTLVATDDEGVASEPLSFIVTVAGGADGDELHVSASQFLVRFDRTGADTFSIQGNFNSPVLPASLAGVRMTLWINGQEIHTGALDARGAHAFDGPPAVRFSMSARSRSYKVSLRSADLLTAIAPANVTNTALKQTVEARLKATDTSGALTYVDATGHFEFDVKSTQGVSASGRFKLSVNRSFDGIFVIPRISAKEVSLSKGGGFSVALSGTILPAGGAELSIVDRGLGADVLLSIGDQPDPIRVPFTAFVVSGMPPKLTYKLDPRAAGAPATLRNLSFKGSKRTISVGTAALQQTGIPLIGSGILSHPFEITLQVETEAGLLTFTTTVLLSRSQDTSGSWR